MRASVFVSVSVCVCGVREPLYLEFTESMRLSSSLLWFKHLLACVAGGLRGCESAKKRQRGGGAGERKGLFPSFPPPPCPSSLFHSFLNLRKPPATQAKHLLKKSLLDNFLDSN